MGQPSVEVIRFIRFQPTSWKHTVQEGHLMSQLDVLLLKSNPIKDRITCWDDDLNAEINHVKSSWDDHPMQKKKKSYTMLA